MVGCFVDGDWLEAMLFFVAVAEGDLLFSFGLWLIPYNKLYFFSLRIYFKGLRSLYLFRLK